MDIWTNHTFWRRVGWIAAASWLLATFVLWALKPDFRWEPHYGDVIGPATAFAVFGVGLILIVCNGIPWVAKAAQR